MKVTLIYPGDVKELADVKAPPPSPRRPAWDVHGRHCIHERRSVPSEPGVKCNKHVMKGRSGWLCWHHEQELFPVPTPGVGTAAPRAAEGVPIVAVDR